MSQSGKAGRLYPPGQTGVDTAVQVSVEQRPMWVLVSIMSSFLRFQRFVADNSLLTIPGGDQAHWAHVASGAGITMGA